MSQGKWQQLNDEITGCHLCPRLRRHCESIGQRKRRAYIEWDYWAKPVPNFGDAGANFLIVGLAPAAHGANRTGRMFTGDRSGDWLYRALHRAGFANQAESTSLADGLQLINCAITAVCHCAPPDNKPSSEEVRQCQTWFDRTVDLLRPSVYIALGQIAWKSVVDHAVRHRWISGRRPEFGHAVQVEMSGQRSLIGSYHPSQQNTFTGRLTEPMFDRVFRLARRAADRRPIM